MMKGVGDATLQMLAQHFLFNFIKGGARRIDLGQYIDAIAVFLNHVAHTAHLPDSSATVASPRIAAKATFALNAPLCFFRILVISNPLVFYFRGETLLPTCPGFGGHLRCCRERQWRNGQGKHY